MSEPIQYREGSVDFCGIKFAVDSRALIPRFETEFLVKKVVNWCSEKQSQQSWQIADIGTGSGNIAISLAVNLPLAKITASDISPAAIGLAQENAEKQNVFARIHFKIGHLLSPIINPPDIIVANLPYIPTSRIPNLDSSVCDFEPHLALNGGKDGFELYRQLLDQIGQLASLPELCVFEIDNDQGEIATQEIRQRFTGLNPQILKDSSQLTRYVVLDFKLND